MRSVIPLVDIMKISDEETTLLTDHADPEEAAHCLLGQGVGCVVVTLGSEGALLCTKDFSVRKPSAAASVVDTTGAGDSSTAAVVWAYLLNHDEDYLITASKASNAAAAMTIEVQESINNDITPELLLHRMNGSGTNIDIIK